jgi:hypothetical protein
MRKSDTLIVVLGATILLFFCNGAFGRPHPEYSMPQPAVQHPWTCFGLTQISEYELTPPEIRRERSAGVAEETDFSRRLRGGILLRFESGLIVVKPTELPASPQPTALTIDAIITSSVKSKIADQSQLRTRGFEVQSDNGVVTIRANEESLEDAAVVINLALDIPEVRQIVYAISTSV